MADPRGGRRSLQIDVGLLVQRHVASLYSSLVTRPTGRAVRLAIETQLAETDDTAFSLIDLSEVTVLDFSCADEVVAKLLMRYLDEDRPRDAFFVFRGVADIHRGPIEAVLERQELAAVAQGEDGRFELLGTGTEEERRAWGLVEEHGRVRRAVLHELPGREMEAVVDRLVRRRLVFFAPSTGEVHALSRLVAGLEGV